MPVVNNKIKNGKAIIRATANAVIEVASLGNPNATIEVVTNASISRAYWSTNGVWTVARGANVILSLHGTGDWDLGGHGMALSEDSAANLVINCTSAGTLLLEVSKLSTLTVNSDYLAA